jgi:putative polyhydroxyalkanoate system protein
MSAIVINQKHTLTHKKARAAAQKVADKLAAEYDMTSEWEGDVLHFQRSGVSGRLTLHEHSARIEIKLGFLLMAFAPKIEDEVGRQMRKVFGAKE